MARSPETIRLHNIDPGRSQLSLHLMRPHMKTSPRLRRGVLLTPIRIAPGRYYDVCLELGVSLDEARDIVAQSAEVKAHEASRRLLIREFPPSEEQLAAEARVEEAGRAAQAKTDALNPPDPPGAIPAGVDPIVAGFRPDELPPKMTRRPSDEASKQADAALTATAPAAPMLSATKIVEEVKAKLAADAAADAAAAESSDPSMDWSVEELTQYAVKKGIDLGNASSKTAILRRIRKGAAE